MQYLNCKYMILQGTIHYQIIFSTKIYFGTDKFTEFCACVKP